MFVAEERAEKLNLLHCIAFAFFCSLVAAATAVVNIYLVATFHPFVPSAKRRDLN